MSSNNNLLAFKYIDSLPYSILKISIFFKDYNKFDMQNHILISNILCTSCPFNLTVKCLFIIFH